MLKSHDEVLFPRYSLQTLRNRHLLHQAEIQKCDESSRENPISLSSTNFLWYINFWCHNMSTPYIHHPKPDKGHTHCLRNSPWDLSQHTPLSQLPSVSTRVGCEGPFQKENGGVPFGNGHGLWLLAWWNIARLPDFRDKELNSLHSGGTCYQMFSSRGCPIR